MGCCVSTPQDNKPKLATKDQLFESVSKSPPRPEEETVKEVLSETPKPKPEVEPIINDVPTNEGIPTKSRLVVSPKKPTLEQKLPYLEKKLPTLEQKLPYLEKKLATLDQKMPYLEKKLDQKMPMKKYPDPSTPEEVSEVSEMCSLSESISTTTLEDQVHQQWGRDASCATSGAEVTQRGNRSQGYNSHLSHHGSSNNNVGHHFSNVGQRRRDHGRSPVRRADPSPPRRRFPGPNSSVGQVGPRRDGAGEPSARRSRSPATRSNVNVGRSPSARRTGPSPGRVRMVHGPESGTKVNEEKVDGHGNDNEVGNENEWEGPKESLENPLVSLECFIFL